MADTNMPAGGSPDNPSDNATLAWPHAQQKLERLRGEAGRGHPPARSIPECLEELATAQLDAPIATNADCAAAIEVGLACVGVGLEEECPGRALVRAAIQRLRAPDHAVTLSPAAFATIRAALLEALEGCGGDLDYEHEPGLPEADRKFEAQMRAAILLLDGSAS